MPKRPPSLVPAVMTAPCRCCRSTPIPFLEGVCGSCRALLPPDLRAEVEETHRRGDVAARLAAQDRARGHLTLMTSLPPLAGITTLEEITHA